MNSNALLPDLMIPNTTETYPEATTGGVLGKSVLKSLAKFTGNTCVKVSF